MFLGLLGNQCKCQILNTCSQYTFFCIAHMYCIVLLSKYNFLRHTIDKSTCREATRVEFCLLLQVSTPDLGGLQGGFQRYFKGLVVACWMWTITSPDCWERELRELGTSWKKFARTIQDRTKFIEKEWQHFWLRQELKESQSPFVCPSGPSLSRALNHHLSGF